MSIAPIRNEEQYQAAIRRIEELWGSTNEEDLDTLEVLAILVSRYEDETDPIGPPDPIEAIKFWMDQKGWNQTDLAVILGVRPNRVSEILGRKRNLSITMIRRLCESLPIPAEVLIQPTSTPASAQT